MEVKAGQKILVQTRILSLSFNAIVIAFTPEYEGSFTIIKLVGSNPFIWKDGKTVSLNIDQVRIYHDRT